jgi:hypothetical protein
MKPTIIHSVVAFKEIVHGQSYKIK